VIHSIACIELQLKYKNIFNTIIETEFYFALSADSCFHNFEAKIGNKVVNGYIKEKKSAKKEYKEGIEAGKTMVYTEIDSEL